jgi:hypothetical protein
VVRLAKAWVLEVGLKGTVTLTVSATAPETNKVETIVVINNFFMISPFVIN